MFYERQDEKSMLSQRAISKSTDRGPVAFAPVSSLTHASLRPSLGTSSRRGPHKAIIELDDSGAVPGVERLDPLEEAIAYAIQRASARVRHANSGTIDLVGASTSVNAESTGLRQPQ